MKLISHKNPIDYQKHVLPFLLRSESCNNLLIALINIIAGKKNPYKKFFLFTIEDKDNKVHFVSIMTPPH